MKTIPITLKEISKLKLNSNAYIVITCDTLVQSKKIQKIMSYLYIYKDSHTVILNHRVYKHCPLNCKKCNGDICEFLKTNQEAEILFYHFQEDKVATKSIKKKSTKIKTKKSFVFENDSISRLLDILDEKQ